MDPSQKADLKNLTKKLDDNPENMETASKDKNIQNIMDMDNNTTTTTKPKKIIKIIEQINPENIKNLGIADQILAAFRKLDANNDLPPSINIDLTKVTNIKSHKFQIPPKSSTMKSAKSLEPSTSKASIQLFDKTLDKRSKTIDHNNKQSSIIKGTLNKFLQVRQNAKLKTNLLSESTTNKSMELSSEKMKNGKVEIETPKHINKSKSLKSLEKKKIEENLNNEIQEEMLLNSILNDSIEDEQTNMEKLEINTEKNKEIDTNVKKNDIVENWSVYITDDKLISPVKSPVHQKPPNINESILQSTNKVEPKVRILHEMKSEKNIENSKVEQIKITENSINNNSEIQILPNISPLKNDNKNVLLYQNYDDMNDDTKIPSFSDLTSHIIEKWRKESKTAEMNTDTDRNQTEIMGNINILELESTPELKPSPQLSSQVEIAHNIINDLKAKSAPKSTPQDQISSKSEIVNISAPTSSFARRRKVVPVNIISMKKNNKNIKINKSFTTVMGDQSAEKGSLQIPNINTESRKSSDNPVESLTTKVTVNINGAQITNYNPTIIRKRKVSTTITENPIISYTKIRKILNIEDHKTKENLNSMMTPVPQENFENNSEIINENLQPKNIKSEIKNTNFEQQEIKTEIENADFVGQNNLENKNSSLVLYESIIGDTSKTKDQNEQTLNNFKEAAMVKDEDGVDFLVNLGDSINHTDDYVCNISSDNESSIDSDNSDFYKKFPDFQNDIIKSEIILNEDNNDNSNSYAKNNIFGDNDNNDDDIESPNYESFDNILINNIKNVQQNENELSIINFQTPPRPEQMKPIVIENKILNENEKIDLMYLKNIPHFETPQKGKHEIGQTILLQQPSSSSSEFIKPVNFHEQLFNINESSYMESTEENEDISDIKIDIKDEYNINNEIEDNINNEIITINQDEYIIEEICTSVNDSNQEISNICIIDENIDGNLNQINNNQNDTEIIQENSMENVNNNLIEYTTKEIDTKYSNIENNEHNKNDLKLNMIKDEKDNLINNDNINICIENLSTDIQLPENLKENKQIPVKSKRMRGGKINLIHRNKQNIIKFDDISKIAKNKETIQIIDEQTLIVPAKETKISLPHESRFSEKSKLTQSISTTTPIINQEILQNNELQEISNTSVNVSNLILKSYHENEPSLEKNLETNSAIFSKNADIKIEKPKNEEILFAVNEQNTKENVKLDKPEENINTNLCSPQQDCSVKNDEDTDNNSRNSFLNDSLDTDEPFFGFEDTEMCTDIKEAIVENRVSIDENINNNISKIIDAKIIENSFDLIKNNTPENHKNECDKLSINLQDSEKSSIEENVSKLSSDQNKKSQPLLDNSSENNTVNSLNTKFSPITPDKKIPKKLSRKPLLTHKISKTNNKNLNIEETSINNINLDDLSDNSTNIENNTIIIKKLCKRRILDSSSDDNEDITPVKKRSICNSVNNKSIRGETSSMSLTKSEDIRKIEASPTKSKKISKKSDHEKHKSQKSSSKEINLKEICNEKVDNKKIHGESSPVSLSKKEIIKKNELPKKSNKISKENDIEKLILEKPSEINLKEIPNKNETISVNESVKIPKNHKTKIRKKEIHQNTVIDKNITEDEIVSSPRENEIKKEKIKKEEITATDFENCGSVIHQNEIINNSNKIENLNETINFETDISKLDIPTTPTSVGPKKRGRKPKIKENSDVVPVEIQPEILNDSRNKTPRRGRARKGVDRKIHPRLLLIDNRADIDKEDTKVNNDKKILQKNEIQCGMCNEIILKSTWEKHKKNHYGIGWKMDEESIDLSSHCAVLNSLINYFKTVKIKSVTCRLCNKSFGSGLGILTHLEMCGLTEDEKRKQCYIKCEYCGGDFSRYSLPTHLKVCKNLSAKLNINYDEEIKENEKGEGNSDEKNIIIGNTGRLKRQSMIRAEDKFKDFNKNSDFDVGEFIKSVTAVRGGQCRSWKKEIEKNGTATCIGKGCKFKCNTYNEIREHVKICKFLMKSGYRCTRCKYHNDSIDNVRAHILKEHKLQNKDFHNSESEEENYKIENDKSSTDDDMSSGVDENEEENQCAGSNNGVDSDDGGVDDKKTTKIRIRDHNIKSTNKHKKIIDIERTYNDKIQFRNWTQYFYKFNYSNSALFQNFTVNCKPSDKILDLFKPKNNLSMKFSFSKNAEINKKFNSSKPLTEWIEMKIFKSETFKNEQIIYIGGPITSIKWLPIDNDKTIPQYLAITYKRNYNKYIHSINPHRQNTLILIYKIGLTTEFNNNNNNNKNLGEFQYGITYENGPIIDMDFLPSGGYIPNINRLGLLAVASTNNDIFIYSLPIKAPQNCDNNNNDLNLIDLNISIQLKLKLLINKNDKSDEIYNVTPTKICWSKAKEHKIIVAGYTNGFIAIWNLTREENLNFMEINEIPTFLPINYFKTSNKSITGLDLHYDSDATRWLIITTIDRTYRILDIEDPSNPIILTEDIAKTFITSTVWPLIWENPCYSTSDELYQSSVQTLNPLIIYYKNRRYSRQSASINDISFNNWYNIMACGGSNGDFSIELNGKMNLDVTQRHEKKLHSYTDLIRLDGNKIDLSLTESVTSFDINFREKYGLIFGPIKYLYKDLTYLQKTRNPPMNMNCYVKINRVASNNNENGNQLYAVGYENGFVRILYINDSNL